MSMLLVPSPCMRTFQPCFVSRSAPEIHRSIGEKHSLARDSISTVAVRRCFAALGFKVCDAATDAQGGGWHEQFPEACLHSLQAAKECSVSGGGFVLWGPIVVLVNLHGLLLECRH